MTAAFRHPLTEAAATPPLAMPDQSFGVPFTDPAAPGIRSPRSVRAVRLAVLTLPLGVTTALAWTGLGWFTVDGHLAATEAALVAVTVVAFYWVVLSVATAVLGVFWRPRPQAAALHGLSIAILLPMYGEPARQTIGNALALLSPLTGWGRHRFSLHILSDTRDPVAAQAELAAFSVARLANPGLALHYRRRAANTDYKSGNIRDWVTKAGQDHDAMLILDADSIMAPDSVILMADRMATEPGLGLIQTVPRVLWGNTLWQRLQSFASEVYGTNLGRGFAMWTGAEGNFLGHNALVRTRAFAACAGLPHLPGRAPRGGVILSHDFVEAALIRRGGWGVKMMPEASESFEDTPETLPGYLRRDRRWCQGNMQHLRLLATPGLHIVSRFHLFQGAMAYLASVWWLALLTLWALSGPGGALPDPFLANPFMPVWPDLPPVSQAVLTGTVGLMLLGPKLLGSAAHLRDRDFRLRDLPGFAVSVLVEIVLSVLLAPALMVHQVRAVLQTLVGVNGGWMPHLTGRPGFRTLLRFHLTETALGVTLLGLCFAGQIDLWLLPVAGSLALTSLLSWLVQRNVASRWFLRPLGTDK
ncbi:glucans biosynthesis glucosyltransferase MdoH [Aliigemmobacter aestuarii]|uniref:Glucans biosynthesis glucosyltransferase H n=1 Tax=Aliigemmobacter aestuarii TaxID=1445661 RepID=A0A4S3MQE0_9RHOB|nr:glucans biosynthesis glucosyltransferase MdoH [Gemmobacter aestuarii]THD84668.1 glucans biosynthesis glucosyltransferase MdoH [Gemmobacter aestuarii]